MLNWNDNTIQWYERSITLDSYAKDTINNIKDYITDKTVIDAGCGIGILSAMMADYATHVTGIDIQPESINYAKDKYQHIHNLDFCTGDLFDIEPDSTDVLACISVGSVLKNGTDILQIPRDHTIIVGSVKSQSMPKKKSNQDEQILIDSGIQYKKILTPTQFGQHFVDKTDARSFARQYNMDEEELLDSLVEIPGDYPLYMPNDKMLRVLIIPRP